jgi:hypothetical protein
MAKSLIDELQEQLEGVENVWLFLFTVILTMIIMAGLTLLGVFLYTRH